ncbi:MAG: hypothetical protein AABZ60_06815 [Planctomycetota bacterium]|mgnify:CR=1 FL=1
MSKSPLILEIAEERHRSWFQACAQVAQTLPENPQWNAKNFYGIVGDLKEKNAGELRQYFEKRPGLAWKLSKLYLTEGIAQGEGYQSCAALSFSTFLTQQKLLNPKDLVCDIGTGVGTIPGALGLVNAHGFDRIPEFLEVCRRLDEKLEKSDNRYWCQDIFDPWQTSSLYEHLILGLVLHQFQHASQFSHFFTQTFSHLTDQGSLWITLPSNTIASSSRFFEFLEAFENNGFQPVLEHCGLVRSQDETEALFWMFLFRFQKKNAFSRSDQKFPSMEVFKQKESRAHKRERIRLSVFSPTAVRHQRFCFFPASLLQGYSEEFNYFGVKKIL